jgi:hypothetical protein
MHEEATAIQINFQILAVTFLTLNSLQNVYCKIGIKKYCASTIGKGIWKKLWHLLLATSHVIPLLPFCHVHLLLCLAWAVSCLMKGES